VSQIEVLPGSLDLEVYGGDDVPIVIDLVNAASLPVTIDGTLKCTISVPYGSPTTQTPTVTAGSSTGQFVINFSSAITRAIAGQGVLLWDLQLLSGAGKVRTLLNGRITSKVEITND